VSRVVAAQSDFSHDVAVAEPRSYASPRNSAAPLSRRSLVSSFSPTASAETNRLTSTHPNPRPISLFASINVSTTTQAVDPGRRIDEHHAPPRVARWRRDGAAPADPDLATVAHDHVLTLPDDSKSGLLQRTDRG
jgi:hypothetical protein